MTRPDLLALGDDDLAALANRGAVKRARKEVESGLAGRLELTPEGDLVAEWSDGPRCVLPSGATLDGARCSCPAEPPCRHVLRSVLALRLRGVDGADGADGVDGADGAPAPATGGGPEAPAPGAAPEPVDAAAEPAPADALAGPEGAATGTAAEAATAESDADGASEGPEGADGGDDAPAFDPGAVDDEALASLLGKAALRRARGAFERGVVAELVRGRRPHVRLHPAGCTVRFLSPDPRYARCDCADAPPCAHVAHAVWAFRSLDAEAGAGILELGPAAAPVEPGLLAAGDAVLDELLAFGLSGATEAWARSGAAAALRLRRAGLAWPAEVLEALVEQQSRYRAADARFSPTTVLHLVGEWVVRRDVIAADTGALPALFVRGVVEAASGRAGEGRYVGLGVGVEPGWGGVRLLAYLDDLATGRVVTVEQGVLDPKDARPPSFGELARRPIGLGPSLEALGRGQLLARGGRRSAGGRLELGRTRLVVNPQRFDWAVPDARGAPSGLRAPAAAESVRDVIETLGGRPPPCLRPRWSADDVFVLVVSECAGFGFDRLEQAVRARLLDREGEAFELRLPFHARGESGSEALLETLELGGLRAVSGRVRLGPGGLELEPLAVVSERDGARRAVLPWIDAPQSTQRRAGGPAEGVASTEPVAALLETLSEALAELLLAGAPRLDPDSGPRWRRLEARAEQLGSTALHPAIGAVARALEARSSTLDWTPAALAPAVWGLAASLELARGDVRD